VESLGIKLKKAREEKGLTCNEISRDINISTGYLESLEAEDFANFPGEAYIVGFLRNYSEYLGLDAEECLSLYRSFKIQEQPMPVEQLLKKHSSAPKILLYIFICLLLAGGIGSAVYYFMTLPPSAALVPDERIPGEFTMTADSLERRFYRGESIIVSRGERQYKLNLANLGETVSITTPNGTVVLDLGQEVRIDLDNDGAEELRIIASDFDKQNSAAGAQLRFELNNEVVLSNVDAGESAPDTAIPEISSPAIAVQIASSTPILSSPNAYPFTLQASFPGNCMFRYERDRRERSEQYYQRTGELNIQAQNGIRIWASNAQAVKLQVIAGGRTVPLELGVAGEVVVADIRWVRDDDSRFRLVMVKVD
jgi:cytoskeletal protein RodZ